MKAKGTAGTAVKGTASMTAESTVSKTGEGVGSTKNGTKVVPRLQEMGVTQPLIKGCYMLSNALAPDILILHLKRGIYSLSDYVKKVRRSGTGGGKRHP